MKDATRDGDIEPAEVLREMVRVREALFRIFTRIVNEETPLEDDLQIFNAVLSQVMSYITMRSLQRPA